MDIPELSNLPMKHFKHHGCHPNPPHQQDKSKMQAREVISTDQLTKSIWMCYEQSRRIEAVKYNINKLQEHREHIHHKMDDYDMSQMMKHTTANAATTSCDLPFMEID